MQIKLAGKRGRTNIESIDIEGFNSEEDLQEFTTVLDFAVAMGAKPPDEIQEMLDD